MKVIGKVRELEKESQLTMLNLLFLSLSSSAESAKVTTQQAASEKYVLSTVLCFLSPTSIPPALKLGQYIHRKTEPV